MLNPDLYGRTVVEAERSACIGSGCCLFALESTKSVVNTFVPDLSLPYPIIRIRWGGPGHIHSPDMQSSHWVQFWMQVRAVCKEDGPTCV